MKQFPFLPFLLASFCILSSLPSFAAPGNASGFFFDETFVPVYVNKNDVESLTPGDNTQVATESGLGFDTRTTLGYTFSSQFIIGLTYNMYSITTSRDAVNGGLEGLNEKTQKSEYGPTVGYNFGNWRVLLTYFLSSTRQVDRKYVDSTGAATGDTTIKNTNGSGFQAALGYNYALGSHFEIGPSLIYRSVSYSKQAKTNRLNSSEDYDATELSTKALDSGLTPMITIQMRF